MPKFESGWKKIEKEREGTNEYPISNKEYPMMKGRDSAVAEEDGGRGRPSPYDGEMKNAE